MTLRAMTHEVAGGKRDQGRSDELDGSLLARVALRDRHAFESLYRAYHPRLGRFLGRLTRRADVVDEVINDTFMVVWQKAGDFRGGSQVSTWIMGIGWRCTMKALRRRGPADGSLEIGDHPLFEPQEERDTRDWVAHGLRLLSLDQRVTLQLAYASGYSIEEIAAIMECPVGTVKARMFHARVKLRNLLPALAGESV